MAQSQPEGYQAIPPSGKGPGVLVLHAWWGLNDTIKSFCQRLADAGFVAFAPTCITARSQRPFPKRRRWLEHWTIIRRKNK